MLWYKDWLETRFRFFFVLGWLLVVLMLNAHRGQSHALAGRSFIGILGLFWLVIPVMLAGTGINTQATFRPAKGLHGSTLFTLSLPVSRLRLLAVRSGLGLLEGLAAVTVVYGATWALFPALRALGTGGDSVKYLLTLSICLCGFYFLGVLLAALLDEQVQIWSSFFLIGLLRWLALKFPLPPSVDIFRALGDASPLITHAFPWGSMGVSLGASAILFWIALKIIEAREY